ncbi:MAG TPA: hypothetical protein DD781_08275 [Leclercia adecarboxylata]|nr:hypothetical protein [Leclercia adecarboxylata]
MNNAVNHNMHPMHKKGLPASIRKVYGYPAPAKSGAGRENPIMYKAINDAECVFFIVADPAYFYIGQLGRYSSMVALIGQLKGWPVPLYTGILTPVSVTTLERENSGGDSLIKYKEAAIMMATTPTQNPHFIWIIAAVRRDCPTIKPVLYHIPAVSEHEARRMLARDHVCFFAGRIRQEVAA